MKKKSLQHSTDSTARLRIVAAQINTLVGDIDGNTEKVIANTIIAKNELHADAVVFPEMAIVGYPPEDLLLRSELYLRVAQAIETIKQETKEFDIYLIIGHPTIENDNCYNAASIIYRGEIVATYHKQHLPNYGVFDEKRYFISGTKSCVCCIRGIKIALTICEDLWFRETMEQAREAHAQLMISINASPFDVDKPLLREQIMSKRVQEGIIPLVYVNCVGGQDELIFDGGSMVLNKAGKVTQRAAFFAEELMPVDLKLLGKEISSNDKKVAPGCNEVISIAKKIPPFPCIEELAYQALVLGVRDYVNKNNFKGAIVSVSGGIDSALTLAIAVDALGKDRVETIYMPSRYSSTLSDKIVKQQAKILNVKLITISIEPVFKAFLKSIAPSFVSLITDKKDGKKNKDSTEENLQARCRGALLMAFSNKRGLIVLSTGNKSEMAVGYSTLYGDMVGGFCVLKDVPKTLVYRLAQYRNSTAKPPIIPPSAIRRIPSAELAPNQKDTDTLPPYPVLDAILERYIEQDQSLQEIVAAGFDEKTAIKVINMVKHNEYKRRQAPPGVRISIKAFGRDRRYPITSGF